MPDQLCSMMRMEEKCIIQMFIAYVDHYNLTKCPISSKHYKWVEPFPFCLPCESDILERKIQNGIQHGNLMFQ